MELDQLFDELEHKFSQQRYDWNRQINCLKVQLVGKEFVDLLAPIIGVNFVAGLESRMQIGLFFHSTLLRVCCRTALKMTNYRSFEGRNFS